jgi:hypothetical protein
MSTSFPLFLVVLASFVGVMFLTYWLTRRFALSSSADAINQATDSLNAELAKRIIDELSTKFASLADYDQLISERAKLEVEVRQLRLAKEEIEASTAWKQREMEHELGLRKKELDAQLQQGLAKAQLDADRRTLDAEKQFNEQALANAQKGFDQQLKATHEITEKLFALVPNLEARLKLKGEV